MWPCPGSISPRWPRGGNASDTLAVEQAVKRLSAALDALDTAMEIRLEADRRRGTLAEEVHDLQLDRSRLAAELDSVQAHSRLVENHNRKAARRLDEAMTAIRDIIEANQR